MLHEDLYEAGAKDRFTSSLVTYRVSEEEERTSARSDLNTLLSLREEPYGKNMSASCSRNCKSLI